MNEEYYSLYGWLQAQFVIIIDNEKENREKIIQYSSPTKLG